MEWRTLAGLALAAGCRSAPPGGAGQHTPGAGIAVPATYAGTIPCADCPGIVLTVTLLGDSSFRLRQVYQERPAVLRQSGRWTVQKNGAKLTLQTGTGNPQRFAIVGADSLRMLNADGHPIQSQANYTLARAAAVDSLLSRSTGE